MKTTIQTAHGSADSSFGITALTAAAGQSNPATVQASIVHRFLNALMRALATPHI